MPNLSRNDFLAVLVSAVLLALAFPPFRLAFFIFIALAPALSRLQPRRHRHNAKLGFWTGLVFYSLLLYWLMHVTVPGMFLLILLLAAFMALAFLCIGYFKRPYQRVLAAGAVFVLIEYLRSLGPFAFAWGYWGHALYIFPVLLQSTYWLGVYGLSCLIAAGNQCAGELYHFARPLYPRRCWRALRSAEAGAVYLLLGGILIAWAANIRYGASVINHLQARYAQGQPVSVGMVQPNIGQEEKAQLGTKDVLSKGLTLSEATLYRRPDLIVWPESTVASPINYWPSIIEEIMNLVKTHNVEMLIGAVYGEQNSDNTWDFWNRAVHFSPTQTYDTQGNEVDLSRTPTYDKMHLVPYGEWVPLGSVWPISMIETLVKEAGAGIFQRGEQQTIFQLRNKARYAVAICYESSLPWLMRRAKKNGAQFLVNITNDAWFKRSPGLMQHFSLSVFRAAENRIPVVRVGNTGITGLISPWGEIVERLPDNKTAFQVSQFTVIE